MSPSSTIPPSAPAAAPARAPTPPLNPLDHLLDPHFSDSEPDSDSAEQAHTTTTTTTTTTKTTTIRGEQLVPEQRHSIIKEQAVIRYFLDAGRDPVLIEGGPGACDGQAGAAPATAGDGAAPPHLDVSLLLDVTKGCGGKIWPAAQVLGAYLTGRREALAARWKGKSVVELGSGTGLVGFVLAKMRVGARVWVTDQDAMLDLMRQNLALNTTSASEMDPCAVAELNWGEPIPASVPSKPDVLLLADCVYLEAAFQPLVDTMVALSWRETEILFCYQKRRKADKRFFTLLKRHFTFDEVSDDDPARTREYTRQGTRLYVVRRR